MLKKLSLAAIIAASGVSFASATPLTEAIKNVDLSGYLRLRLYNHDKYVGYKGTRWRTTALFKFVVPVSEELKFVSSYAFDWNIFGRSFATSGDSKVNNVKFFLNYSNNGLTALVGKIPVPTPITATGVGEATAAGAIALYKVNDNFTVAAAGLDDLVGTDQYSPNSKNTLAAAAMFNQDALKAEAWYFYVKNAIDSDVVLRANYSMDNINLHADFATASLDDKKIATGATIGNIGANNKLNKTQTYFNVSAKYAMDNICAKIGYAQTGKDGGIVNLDADSPLAAVASTQQIYGITDHADTNMVYGKVGYAVDPKTSVYGAATFINDTNSKKVNDYTIGVKYKYTKKLGIHVYYDILNADKNNAFGAADNDEFRFEAKYSF